MPVTLTKTGIRFDEARFWRVVDPDGGADHLWGTAGYVVSTAQGEEFRRDFTAELTGAARTRVVTLLSDLTALIKEKEGIT